MEIKKVICENSNKIKCALLGLTVLSAFTYIYFRKSKKKATGCEGAQAKDQLNQSTNQSVHVSSDDEGS